MSYRGPNILQRPATRNLVVAAVIAAATLANIGSSDGLTPFHGPGASNSPGFVASSRSAAIQTPQPTETTGRLSAGPQACVQTPGGAEVWRLTFADDFDGSSLEESDWELYHSPGNAGFGLRRPEAIAVADGLLVLTAQMIDGVLYSGGMAHRTNQVYGRWEFRVRTDPDPSGATSGVVLTWPGSNRWPIDGENNMYETGRTPDRTPFMSYVHYGADNDQEQLVHDADGTEWHEVAMEWTADRITIFRDGAFAGEVTAEEVIPDVAHHMTIQLDAWADKMGDPVQMFVDWVRVYRLDSQANAC